MCLLIETIKIKDNQVKYINYHNRRFNDTRKDLFGIMKEENLRKYINTKNLESGNTYKCRLTYGTQVEKIEYIKYTMKPIQSLRLIRTDTFSYHYKYQNRSALLKLYKKRKSADDILICVNKKITDTTYANVALYNGIDWITPRDPLLLGSARARYLDKGLIKEKEILESHLDQYQSIRIFNALINFGDIELSIADILI